MSARSEIVLGIDLGTTYSCAAYVEGDRPKIIPSEKGYATLPSVVGLSQKGDVIVGHPALDRVITKPEHAVYGSKRLIGRKFNSLVVQQMREVMTYPIVEGPGGDTAVMLGEQLMTLPQISALILGEIKEVAQRHLDREVRRAVITVPAYYSDNQRHAVKAAGKLAGLEVDRIVNEPTAAAIAYGFKKGFDQKILVFDLGGGTFDVSILHVKGNEFKVLATGGNSFLGGVDFDHRIVDYSLEKFREASGKDIRKETVAVQRVRSAAERAKRDLSVERTTKIQLPYITEINHEPVDLSLTLTREQLNRLTNDLVERTLEMCGNVMNTVEMKPSDLDEILLVGGQTRMPLVRGRIHAHFGIEPRKGVHPDEVVAVGASILGKAGSTATGVTLKDVLSIPIGIALPSGRFKTVLDQNMPIPASKAYKVNMLKKQPFEIDVYQGVKSHILENEYLGTFQIPAPSAKTRGNQQVEMRFDLSEECLLTVRAKDLATGAQSSAKMVTVQTPKSLQTGLAEEVKKEDGRKEGWFNTFARRVLGGR